jgi:hypothetical protein
MRGTKPEQDSVSRISLGRGHSDSRRQSFDGIYRSTLAVVLVSLFAVSPQMLSPDYDSWPLLVGALTMAAK